MSESAVPLMDPSWWDGHALASLTVRPSATWCWFNARCWLPEIDLSPRSVPTADAALLLRQAALLLEAMHRGGASRQWLSAADLVWARRTGLAMFGAIQMPRLSMVDALPFFDEAEQSALRLALPRELAGHALIAVEAIPERRARKLLEVCKRYTGTCDADAPTGFSS